MPAGPATLVLKGVLTHIAPIDKLFRALFKGGDPLLEGSVAVHLQAGRSYRVTGAGDALRREVWIEDDTGAMLPGMSKEQVLMALGRPRLDLTASLDADEWPYPGVDNDEVCLVFGDGGVPKDVDGARKPRRALLHDAPPPTRPDGPSGP